MFSWVLIGTATFISLWFYKISSIRTKPSSFNIYIDVSIKMAVVSSFFLIYTSQTQSEGCQVSKWTSSGIWWCWFLACFPSFLEKKYYLILENCDSLWEICSPFIWEDSLLYKEICTTGECCLLKCCSYWKGIFPEVQWGNLQSAVP